MSITPVYSRLLHIKLQTWCAWCHRKTNLSFLFLREDHVPEFSRFALISSLGYVWSSNRFSLCRLCPISLVPLSWSVRFFRQWLVSPGVRSWTGETSLVSLRGKFTMRKKWSAFLPNKKNFWKRRQGVFKKVGRYEFFSVAFHKRLSVCFSLNCFLTLCTSGQNPISGKAECLMAVILPLYLSCASVEMSVQL